MRVIILLAMLTVSVTAQQVMPLQCAGGDCPLLRGEPQTRGMRSGFVRLKPGDSVGWHSTNKNEEQLVVIRGKGEAQIGDQHTPFEGPCVVYIGPGLRHNVINRSSEILEYVYVVAPAK